jgi:hypothetical protein
MLLEWFGKYDIHTPDGVRGPENEEPFEASADWISHRRRWLKSGLLRPATRANGSKKRAKK